MAEGTGFENRRAGNRTGGSNPSSSAAKVWREKREWIIERAVGVRSIVRLTFVMEQSRA